MRHRRAKRPAKQKRTGHGRHPFLTPEHKRRLLFTRTACCFFMGRNAAPLCVPASRRIYSLLRVYPYYLPCGCLLLPFSPTCKGNLAQAHVATGSANEDFAQHRYGVRMRYRGVDTRRSQDMQGLDRPARTSRKRCPLLLFTRTGLALYKRVIDAVRLLYAPASRRFLYYWAAI